jgi:predicted ribosomally synthesized peptide with nif11-like leader
MSIEAVNQFLQKVTEDQQLQEELAKALESENDRQAATDLAAKYGYEFTPDELWAEVQNRQSEFQQKQQAGELSDEELEAVAGGRGGGLGDLVQATSNIIAPLMTNDRW